MGKRQLFQNMLLVFSKHFIWVIILKSNLTQKKLGQAEMENKKEFYSYLFLDTGSKVQKDAPSEPLELPTTANHFQWQFYR